MTDVAGDAGPDPIQVAREGFVGKLRVGDQGPQHPDQVDFALDQKLVCEDRVVDPVDRADRDLDHLLDARGIVREHALGREIRAHGGGERSLVDARGDMDLIHAGLLQIWGHGRSHLGSELLFDGHEFGYVQLDQNREVLAAAFLDARDDLAGETCPVL